MSAVIPVRRGSVASDSVDCYPGGCPWHVFTKDGKVVREEQAGALPHRSSRDSRHEPDGLPEGRLLEPLPLLTRPRHAAAQARGRARRGQVRADLLGRGAQRHRRRHARRDPGAGPGSRSSPRSRPRSGAAPARAFADILGLPVTDGNAEFQDFSPGWHLTWGLFNPVSSMDDWFLAELTLIWHANPVYTNIHWYHYSPSPGTTAARSSRSRRTTAPRRSTPTTTSRSGSAPTPRWRWRCAR